MLLAGLLLTALVYNVGASVNGIIDLSGHDRAKLMSAFTSGFVKLQPDDLDSLYYATRGYNIAKSSVVRVFELDGCHHLQTYYKPDAAPEAQLHALTAFSLLKCTGKLQTDATITSLKASLDKGSTADIRFAMETLQYLKQSIPNPAKIAQNLQARLKEDDSLVSLGHALHASAMLGTHGKFINDRIEDIVVQADEVDSKMLQFEGGLSVTSLILTGLYQIQGAKPFTQEQVDKFANYLLTRRSVQTAKGAVMLMEAAEALSKSNIPPVCITLVTNTPVSLDKPELKIRISDLLGNPLKPQPSQVVAQSATRVTDDVVVLSKQPLSPGTAATEFVLPMKLEPGQYKIALSAGQHSSVLMTRVVGPIKIESVELGVEVIDGSQAAKLSMIQYPQKMTTPLQADSNHNLVAKFALPRAVHQAFLRLYTDTKEIIFIGERDATKMYKVIVNLGTEVTASGLYKMELILGDAIMSNPLRWEIGSVDIKLTNVPDVSTLQRGAKPEIEHMFRQPEKRPPQVVSMLFTALCAAPLLLLLIMWIRIGVPLNYFNFYSIPFHVGFTGIMGLYTYFWLCGNMFTTCAWLLYIGGFTFIAGNRMLRNIASNKK